MRNFLLSLLLINSFISYSQITITSSDIGSADDTVRYSSAKVNTLDFSSTDTNHIWDFSSLQAKSQTIEGYVGMANVNMIYKVAFFGKSNLAKLGEDINLLGLSIANPYTFYKKDNNQLKIVGMGGEVSGINVPIVYTSSDVVYKFPMNYGNLDSSDSHFSIGFPNMGYLEEDLHRINEVDGWGTIITPYGTYQCLRLKSTINKSDSVYIDSLNFGARIPNPSIEYIWLAKGMDFPIVKVTVGLTGINFKYIDNYIDFTSVENAQQESLKVTVSPNPCTNNLHINISKENKLCNIIIYDYTGKVQYNNTMKNSKTIDVKAWASGIYFIEINTTENIIIRKKFIVL